MRIERTQQPRSLTAGRTPESWNRRYDHRERRMQVAATILGGVLRVDGKLLSIRLPDGEVLQRREALRRAAVAAPERSEAGCRASNELGRACRRHDAAKKAGSPRVNELRSDARDAMKEYAVLTW